MQISRKTTKKLETIKSLKEKISSLTNEVATFKEKAQGKEEIEKELNDIKIAIKRESLMILSTSKSKQAN